MIPSEFDDIRSYEAEELPKVYERLLLDPQFQKILTFVMPGVPLEKVRQEFFSCKTPLEFQLRLCYNFLDNLIKKTTLGCTMDSSEVDASKRYTFVSNHRDITIDSAFLSKMLVDNGFGTTCEIAIGDNLLGLSWVEDFVRLTKSFIVKRGLPPRDSLLASKKLSNYMYYVAETKHDNIWIAQREGRAKDSDDRTQTTILKMMIMGGPKAGVIEKLKRLNIVPLTISYEYDASDYLKAKEFQAKRDDKNWKKQKAEDIESMRSGILGWKGHMHYHTAPCINSWLDTLDESMPRHELLETIAHHIDEEIHKRYRLYPSNYIAMDMLKGGKENSSKYSDKEKEDFLKYLRLQIEKINLPHKDEDFLLERMLTMYANPAINYFKATSHQ
ncbi:MAG: 1-acyl-sn-glycerol-3-phosphate acyltransferase [Prevotella sp.]|nr:1-acyl-sn-glycerol-3-phosphate acyltransferase [Prevotella sp.]